MSETRDEATGQFTPSTEGLFGRDLELAEAGYKPMQITPKAEQSELTVREAADELIAQSGTEPEPEKIVVMDTTTGEPINEKPSEGVVESLTVEDAAKLLSDYHAGQHASAEHAVSAEFAAAVDEMRAEALKQNPKLAEHYGIEPPEAKPIAENNNKSGDQSAKASNDGLDPDLAEQIRKHPQVRQAIEEELGETHKVRQSYSAGLENARVHTLATLGEVVPHLAGLPPQQFEQGLAVLAEVDPPAFQKAMNILGRAHAISQAQQQEQQQQAHTARQNFQTYASEQDTKYRSMVGEMPPAGRAEFGEEMVSYASELGIDRGQLIHLLQNEPIMRHASFQKMIHDAVQARLFQKKTSAAAKAVPKTIPPVQRPGTSQPSGSSRSGNVAALEARFSRTGSLKDAQALYAAKLSIGQ